MASQPAPPVVIHVDAAHTLGEYHPVWNYFGADEPNYTYTHNGAQLLKELSRMSSSALVHFRPHNLLTSAANNDTGDGSLKWGSTGVYREGRDGKPIYDWAITDKLFDNLVANHIIPMVEIGFMPEALSSGPAPYRHSFPANPDVFTGWSYPPKDDAKWRGLIVAYTAHLHQRYGAAVEGWSWEVWNEPDIPYFHGTPEQYFRLYDITTGAIRQVLPHAIVGGPAVTGGGENKSFLKLFLEHCARGVNADSSKTGAPLDFISFHPKGSPKFLDATATSPAHVRMNLARQLSLTDRGFQIIAGFAEYRNTPIILSETDPEGCAACKGAQNGYRNGPVYGVSVTEMLVRSAQLARLRGVNLAGAVTWAFEFEGQPPFAGFRELASNAPRTNGAPGLIDKPVLNIFRLFGMLEEAGLASQYLGVSSSGAIPIEQLTQKQVIESPDVDGIALRHGRTIDVLLWNYHDDDLPAPAAAISLRIDGLNASQVKVQQYRVDHDHANAYSAWLAMGSPQTLTPEQIAMLRKANGLIPLETGALRPSAGSVSLTTTLPRQGVALYRISW